MDTRKHRKLYLMSDGNVDTIGSMAEVRQLARVLECSVSEIDYSEYSLDGMRKYLADADIADGSRWTDGCGQTWILHESHARLSPRIGRTRAAKARKAGRR